MLIMHKKYAFKEYLFIFEISTLKEIIPYTKEKLLSNFIEK